MGKKDPEACGSAMDSAFSVLKKKSRRRKRTLSRRPRVLWGSKSSNRGEKGEVGISKNTNKKGGEESIADDHTAHQGQLRTSGQLKQSRKRDVTIEETRQANLLSQEPSGSGLTMPVSSKKASREGLICGCAIREESPNRAGMGGLRYRRTRRKHPQKSRTEGKERSPA